MSELDVASSDFFRKGCFVAALWYFLASSNLAAFTVDNIFPRFKTVNPSASSCVLHGCGCKLDKASQKGCCCLPKITPAKTCHLHNHLASQNETPRRVKMNFLSVARCKGHLGDNAVLTSHLNLHLLPVSAGILKEDSVQSFSALVEIIHYNFFPQPLEKVPLSSSAVFSIF